jgi:hypothetical protein
MRLRDGQVIDGTAFYDSIAFKDLSGQATQVVPPVCTKPSPGASGY